MAPLMDLVAGDRREVLLTIAVEDWAALADADRFQAHLALGGGLDPTWLDLFSEAVRRVTGRPDPIDFIDAREGLPGRQLTERTVERIDPTWLAAVAEIPESDFAAIAGRWIDLVQEEFGDVGADEKPWIRALVSDLVHFAERASGASDVLFAWSI